MMTNANDASGGKLKPLIKMAKHWSRHNFDRICSFHIELICAAIFKGKTIENYQIGMAAFLVHLPDYVGTPTFDPIYGVSRVDKELTQQEQAELAVRIHGDGERAIEALRLENAGYQQLAIEKWKEIFLVDFPK